MQVDIDERYRKCKQIMEDNKYNLKIYWKCNENAIIKCLFYMYVLEFKGLNGYYICPIEWNSRD